MKDSTVMNRLPIRVTAHSGMLSKKPQSSIACTIESGRVVFVAEPTPDDRMIVDMIPCAISNKASIRSIPYVTTPLAMANLINSFSACSGLLTSVRLPHVFTTPTRKNKTSSARPMPFTAPLICAITCHMPPPLKDCGDMVSNDHTSAIFVFHVSSAF